MTDGVNVTMSRDDLEAIARERGIADPDAFGNKAELIAAIEAASGDVPNPGTTQVGTVQTGDTVVTVAETPFQPVRADGRPFYLVDGIEVDPNGKPIKA